MNRIYDCGKDSNTIKIAVEIGSVGIPYTVVFNVRKGGQQAVLKKSKKSKIAYFEIGKAEVLRDSYILVRTFINLSSISKDDREKEIEMIKTKYKLKGGKLDEQQYRHDDTDIFKGPDNEVIEITKPIKLI